MMNKPHRAMAEARARGVLRELGITDPEEIDVALIAAEYNAFVQEMPLSGTDGMMVRKNDKAIITVRSTIPESGKKRFVIAHELGHVLMHKDTRQADLCTAGEVDKLSYSKSKEELEANYFAAELLMPDPMFTAAIDHSIDPAFSEIGRLANKFNTTLSATAIQYVKYNSEPCAFIISKDLMNPWFFCTENFGFQLERRKKVHAYTCAHEVVKTGARIYRDSKISAGTWLQGFSDTGKDYITEESLALGSTGIVYTLLWVHDAI